MNSVKELINLYKGLRNKSLLQGDYKMKYAFVGIGSHSINNLEVPGSSPGWSTNKRSVNCTKSSS